MRSLISTMVAIVLMTFVSMTYAQMHSMQRNQSKGRCPMCGQRWDGQYHGAVSIPKSLVPPKSRKWIKKLQKVLSDEKLSKLQYEADSKKFQLHMPYQMVIPQETNHINWITRLLKAYGKSTKVAIPKVKNTKTAKQAYKYAMKLELALIPKYKSLIKNAEDNTARKVLGIILLQTRIHYDMFSHALTMGGMRR